MSTPKINSQGSSFHISMGGTYSKIGSLTSIGEFGGTADEMEITTLDSEGGYKEFMGGFRDGGSLALSGFFTASEEDNQSVLIESFDSGQPTACYVQIGIESPIYFTFNGFVQDYKIGAIEVGSPVGFSATVRISSKPVRGTSAPTTFGAEMSATMPAEGGTISRRR